MFETTNQYTVVSILPKLLPWKWDESWDVPSPVAHAGQFQGVQSQPPAVSTRAAEAGNMRQAPKR